MAFAAIHIPDFLVQAVIRGEPALRGAAWRLWMEPAVWNVVAASEPAFRAGVELGMARACAEQFEAVQIRPRSRMQEKSAHAALLDLGWSVSPRVEDTAPDTIVDRSRRAFFSFGSDENIAHQLALRVSALGLVAHVAIASNLEVAVHAARGFPGITLIPPGEEAKRLGICPSVRSALPRKFSKRWSSGVCARAKHWQRFLCLSFRSAWGKKAFACTSGPEARAYVR